MNKRPLIVSAVASAVLLAGVSVTAVANASESGDALQPELLQQRVDELAAAAKAAVVAEVRDGDETWSGAAGPRELDGDIPAEPTDNVRIGSITKTFTTTVLMRLAEDGALDLDANVNDVAPDLLPYEDAITVRNLLQHTSGVPEYTMEIYPSLRYGSLTDLRNNRGNEYTAEELVGLVSDKNLDFEPGTEFEYSNTNFILLGMIVENLTGNTVEDEVTDRILETVGMEAAYMPENQAMPEDPFVHAYFPHFVTGERIDTTEFSATQQRAAGSIVAPPADVNSFYRALFAGDLISRDSLEQMRQFTSESDGMFGLGLQEFPVGEECAPLPGGVAHGHTGGTFGHTSFSFSSTDGERQLTYTLGLDPQTLPLWESGDVTDSVESLRVAGLCDAESAPAGFDAEGIDPEFIAQHQ